VAQLNRWVESYVDQLLIRDLAAPLPKVRKVPVHAGCVILVGMDHSEFGVIIRRIKEELESRPDPKDWLDYTCFISRVGKKKRGITSFD